MPLSRREAKELGEWGVSQQPGGCGEVTWAWQHSPGIQFTFVPQGSGFCAGCEEEAGAAQSSETKMGPGPEKENSARK